MKHRYIMMVFSGDTDEAAHDGVESFHQVNKYLSEAFNDREQTGFACCEFDVSEDVAAVVRELTADADADLANMREGL